MSEINTEKEEFFLSNFKNYLLMLKALNFGWLLLEIRLIVYIFQIFFMENTDLTSFFSIFIFGFGLFFVDLVLRIKLDQLFIKLPTNKKPLDLLENAKAIIIKNIDNTIKILNGYSQGVKGMYYTENQCEEYKERLVKIKTELNNHQTYCHFILYMLALTDKKFNEKTIFTYISRKCFSHGLFLKI